MVAAAWCSRCVGDVVVEAEEVTQEAEALFAKCVR